MVVVAVLMISRQVSTSRRSRRLGPQMRSSQTQKAKTSRPPATLDANPANRSKKPTRDDTSVGIKIR
jgi:hypothetical protein